MGKDEGAAAAATDNPLDAVDTKPAQSATLARSAIVRSRTNPRTHFDEAYLNELAASIKEHSVIQPLLVRPLPGARAQETFEDRKKGEPLPTHEIVCGECRWRAAGIADVDELPVLIRHLNDVQVLQIQLVENLKRRDLHPLEEAEGFDRLMKDHGLSVEDIAARIGKSESYVFKLRKLLELTPECREILYQGKLTQSTALLVARAPAYLQQEIAKDIMEGGYAHGEPMSFRQAQDHIHRRYMLRLTDAVFDIKDASLVAKAGACTTCAKNTGCNKDLFGDVGGGDTCTDPKCFDQKKVAHMDATAKKAKAQGKDVIAGKEAKELYPDKYSGPKGYTRLDASHYLNGSWTTVRKALGKDVPATTLLQNPFTKQLEEALPNAVANKLLKQAETQKKAAAVAKKKNAEPSKQELEDRARGLFYERSVEAVFAAVMAGKSKGITVRLAREIAKFYTSNLYGEPANRFARLFNLNATKVATSAGIEDFLDLCDEKFVGPALLLLMVESDLDSHNVHDKTAPVLECIASDAGVDLNAIRESVKTDMKAEAAERKMQAQAKVAGKETPAKTAPKAKPAKTSAAEAKAGISNALQIAAGVDVCEPKIGRSIRVNRIGHKHVGRTGVLGPFVGDSWKVTFDDDGCATSSESPTGRVKRLDFIVIAAARQTQAMTFEVGDRVRFKDGLRGPSGHFRKVSGREGTVDHVQTGGDEPTYGVRYGVKGSDYATARWHELELLHPAAAKKNKDDAAMPLNGGGKLDPAAAWPFPTASKP